MSVLELYDTAEQVKLISNQTQFLGPEITPFNLFLTLKPRNPRTLKTLNPPKPESPSKTPPKP